MRVQLPVLVIAIVRRRAVPAHRIRKARFKQVVVAGQATLQNVRQTPALFVCQFRQALHVAAGVFREAADRGFQLKLVDIGGGFPAPYDTQVQPFKTLAKRINSELDRLFPKNIEILAEPGRFLVATAGTAVAKVIGKATRVSQFLTNLDKEYEGTIELGKTTNSQDADGEVMLDIEVSGAVAPGAKLAVYFAPNSDQGFHDAIVAAAHDAVRRPSILSISWGGPEDTWTEQASTAMNAAPAARAIPSAADQIRNATKPPISIMVQAWTSGDWRVSR